MKNTYCNYLLILNMKGKNKMAIDTKNARKGTCSLFFIYRKIIK
jgi:hypothetical protein